MDEEKPIFKDVAIKVSIDQDRDIHIPDSPWLRDLRKQLELGCQVLDMRKRYFFFFKRKLRPHEKKIELTTLMLEEQMVR